MAKSDRRVERTRELLQKALIELISESGYGTITIQDLVDRAKLGRTTFYLHYGSKDELFMSCHEAMISELHFGPLYPISREELLSADVPPGVTSAYRHLSDARALLYPIFQGTDSPHILRRIRDRSAQEIEASLRNAFTEADSAIPIDVLASCLAGAQIALLQFALSQWRMEKRLAHTPEKLAQTFHRLQRAAIRDAFGLTDGE